MESLNALLNGFSIALSLTNIIYCLIGCLLGTLVGVLPGIGPAAAIALLFPTAMRINPIGAMVMLAGIYYGAQYGGSTTSILLNIPGEATSVVTCLDGYQMARNGRAGPALGISAFGSFIGGTLTIMGLVLFAPLLANAALKFGPPEFFSLTVMCMTMVTYLSKGSFIKALMMVPLGLILATVGMDPHTGTFRFTYGTLTLKDGLGIVPIVMGLFGISEVMINVGTPIQRTFLKTKIKDLFPSLQDWKDSKFPILRGTLVGFVLGALPGMGLSSPFLSYGLEKKLSKHPEKFGTGIIEGVAAPETCNNAEAQASFHSDVKSWYSCKCHYGHASGGTDGIWNHTGASSVKGPSRSFLGTYFEYVYRECHASCLEPTLNSSLGSDFKDPILLSLPLNTYLLYYWLL